MSMRIWDVIQVSGLLTAKGVFSVHKQYAINPVSKIGKKFTVIIHDLNVFTQGYRFPVHHFPAFPGFHSSGNTSLLHGTEILGLPE